MIVKADCNQIEDDGMYLNIENNQYIRLGVWTDCSQFKTVLYKRNNEVWFMQFRDEDAREEFELVSRSGLEILWES